MDTTLLYLFFTGALIFFLTIFAFTRRYKRCPSDKILVVYGKISGGGIGGLSAKCYHGGASFIWPVLQNYRFLDLTPMAIDINLQGALSHQNIRINTPSTFTIGISTEPVRRLQKDHAVYMVDSSRINIAGITAGNVGHIARSVAAVL